MYFLIKCQKFYVFSDKKIKNINNAKCLAKFKSGCFEAEIIDASHSEKTLQIKCRKFNDDLDAVELTEQFPEVTRPDSTKVEAPLDSVELTEQCPQVTRGGSTKVEALLDKRNGDRTKTRTVDVAGSKTIVSFVKDVCASNKLNEDRGTVDVAGSQTGFSFGNSLPNFEKDVGAFNKLNEDRGTVDEDGSETGVSFVNESTPYFKNNIGIQTDNQCNDPEAENETDSESSQIQGDPFEDSGSEYQDSKTESESENVITPIKRRSRKI
ncbi:uncharacterized protein LOC121404032 isoform X2 [Drosophila obscura]|uniref:uncharacterized protein LOC121404032 isoform X2 n=1 Tax=Drosophila obscura TaxID=7282 RepID=UPI001BB264F6|nr:uncharacterized protein LOC121404032 isoform X2 [Drosophila obscura]